MIFALTGGLVTACAVRLAEAVPVSDSYECADSMGFFWSMEPDGNAERVIGYDRPL